MISDVVNQITKTSHCSYIFSQKKFFSAITTTDLLMFSAQSKNNKADFNSCVTLNSIMVVV
jgi:hypothetical protein